MQVELRKLYRSGRRGEIQTQDMTRLSSVLMQLTTTFRDSDLERRTEALEEKIQQAIEGAQKQWHRRAA